MDWTEAALVNVREWRSLVDVLFKEKSFLFFFNEQMDIKWWEKWR